MREQLDMERRLIGEATSWTLLKEMWTIAGNRKRALISIGLMVCQQMTGTNTLVSPPICPAHCWPRLNIPILTNTRAELLCAANLREDGAHGDERISFCDRSIWCRQDALVDGLSALRSRQPWAPQKPADVQCRTSHNTVYDRDIP